MRHTTVSLGFKAAGAALLSITVAAFLTVATTGAGILSLGGPEQRAPGGSQASPPFVGAGVLGIAALGRAASALASPTGSSSASQLASSGAASESLGGSVALHGVLSGAMGNVFSTAHQTSTLTPALVGLLNRQGVPPGAYRAAEGGYDVQGTHDDEGNADSGDVSWAELQPAAGGPIAPNNAIDQAIAEVDTWNAANPIHHEALKLRVVVGIHSPSWAMNLGGQCFKVTDPNSGASGCCPRFWTPAFSAAYYQFEAELATKYDGVPEIGEVVMAKNTTVYNESLVRQTQSRTTVAAMMAAGYSTTLDKQEQLQDIASLGTYWKRTHVGFAFNPYQTASPNTQDEAFTERVIAAGRLALGAQLVLENNSLREDYLTGSGNYQSMYAYMDQVGGPIAFQTSTLGRSGSLTAVLDGAIALAAGSVELPAGYPSAITPAQAAAISRALA